MKAITQRAKASMCTTIARYRVLAIVYSSKGKSSSSGTGIDTTPVSVEAVRNTGSVSKKS